MNASTFTACDRLNWGGCGLCRAQCWGDERTAMVARRRVHRRGRTRRRCPQRGQGILDRGEKLMGFGHRVYRAEDPRAQMLRAAASRLGAPATRSRSRWSRLRCQVFTPSSRAINVRILGAK